LGDDLAEGKMTLPLIRALAVGNADEVVTIRHAIAGGGLTDFAPVVAALERTGALSYAKERASVASQAATRCLDGLPPSPCGETLLQLPAFAVDRRY
jgi:octaprenyl-diphosphate synthase